MQKKSENALQIGIFFVGALDKTGDKWYHYMNSMLEECTVVGRVIFVTAFKGGVGKTTVSSGIACALASLGKKVCVVDADFGMRCMDLVLGLSDAAMYDCSDVLTGTVGLSDALLQCPSAPGVWFLPAPIRYDGRPFERETVERVFSELRDMFDFCILDSSAELTGYYRLFADVADDALVVTLHQTVSIRAAEKTAAHLASFGHYNVKLVVNCFREEQAKKGTLPCLTEIILRSSVPLLGVVPRSEDLQEDQEAVRLPLTGKENAKLKPYEAALLNIASRLCGLTVPLWDGVEKPKRKKKCLLLRKKTAEQADNGRKVGASV